MNKCTTKNCHNEADPGKRVCDECRIRNKRVIQKRWRQNHPNYNREYLRGWIKDLRAQEKKLMYERLMTKIA